MKRKNSTSGPTVILETQGHGPLLLRDYQRITIFDEHHHFYMSSLNFGVWELMSPRIVTINSERTFRIYVSLGLRGHKITHGFVQMYETTTGTKTLRRVISSISSGAASVFLRGAYRNILSTKIFWRKRPWWSLILKIIADIRRRSLKLPASFWDKERLICSQRRFKEMATRAGRSQVVVEGFRRSASGKIKFRSFRI